MSSRPQVGTGDRPQAGTSVRPQVETTVPRRPPASGQAAGDMAPVAEFRYPEAALEPAANHARGAEGSGAAGLEDLARAAGSREGEERARVWYEAELERERGRLGQALEGFARQREAYFRDVEREAVQLTLRIANKVLERETRADPLAVAAMVHVALASLQTGTAVTLRVHPASAQDWRLHFAARQGAAEGTTPAGAPAIAPAIVEDSGLAPGDCVLETAMGTADISLSQKLREIEDSFLDLLAQRPGDSRHES